jgi:hypothetical protein
MAHAQNKIGSSAGVDCLFGSGLGQGQRLLAEYVLSGCNSTLDLLSMQRVWRCKDDGFNARMLQGFAVIRITHETVLAGKCCAIRVWLRRTDDFDVLLCILQNSRHLLAPPAKADHCYFHWRM